MYEKSKSPMYCNILLVHIFHYISEHIKLLARMIGSLVVLCECKLYMHKNCKMTEVTECSYVCVCVCVCVYIYIYISRLTVVGREAKKKQHACASSGPHDHYSELFTRMAALNF